MIGPRAALLALLTAVGGCAETAAHMNGCGLDAGCPPASPCTGEACVPKLTAATRPFAVEMVPPSDGTWAHTEQAAVVFTAEGAKLQVDEKAMLTGSVEREETDFDTSADGTLRVIASFPSTIRGRRDRLFESRTVIQASRVPSPLVLPVPKALVGQEARVRLVPSPPLDRILPPWTETVRLSPALKVRMLRPADTYLVEGTLQDDFERPERGYEVRAMVQDRLVSSVGVTDEEGRFRIRIPKGPANMAALETIAIELAPADPLSTRPRLVVRRLNEGRLNVGVLRLPPAPRPETLAVPVVGVAPGKRPEEVVGATVRFRTVLVGMTTLQAVFHRDAQTDKEGSARIELVPGAGGQTRDYSVAVIPPADSPFAARCVEAYSVASRGTGGTRVGAPIELARKPVLTGRVTTASGTPAPNVRITAVREDPTFVKACETDVASPPATALTAPDGRYELLLEAGTYRLEYAPPVNVASPLHAESALGVSADRRHDVTLPAGVLVEAAVEGVDGKAVGDCDVRAYDTGRESGAMRARARSGGNGRVRLVLPSGN